MERYKTGDITFSHGILRIYTNTGYLYLPSGSGYDEVQTRACASDSTDVMVTPAEPVVLTMHQLKEILCQHYTETKREAA